MSKLAHSLAELAISAQAEFDEKTRLVEELAEKAAEISELKRQLDKVYNQRTEHSVEAATAVSVPVEASYKLSSPPSRCGKLSTDALSDALVYLNRFNIDAAQITCHRWRYAVEKMLTMHCLRELTSVTLKREQKDQLALPGDCRTAVPRTRPRRSGWTSWGVWSDSESDQLRYTLEDADCVFVFSFHRTGEAAAPLGGTVQEDMQRRLTFQSCDLDTLVPREGFFEGLLSIAATVRVEHLILSDCHLDDVDVGSFQAALLQFQSISELEVGFRLLPGHISDGFLADAGRKPGLTQLRYDTTSPIGPPAFDATDYGLMQFLFQRTEEEVKLLISHVNISPMFCASIFKKALSEPAKNDLLLVMRVRNLEQDLSGILGWRITKNKNFDNKEVYTAEDSCGQRICLTINRLDSLTMKEWGWRSSTIDFRRSKQCRCKSACAPDAYVSNDGNFDNDYDDIHAGGFGANRGFDDDGW